MPLFTTPLPRFARPTRFDSPLDRRLDAERKARSDARLAEVEAWYARFDAAAPPAGTVAELKALIASLGGLPVPGHAGLRSTLIARCRVRFGLDAPDAP